MRRHAENWLEVAERVWNFRRDQLTAAQGQGLLAASGELKGRMKERADAGKLKLSIEKLEGVLRETGGRYYPMSSLTENVEFFLVAALVILGLRAYFVQPFKIPTNSMWPSYYGMTHESFQAGEEPGLLARTARTLAFGASHYQVEAPADGEVYVPVYATSPTRVHLIGSEKAGRSYFLFPTQFREWTFMVNGQLVKLSTPADFDGDFEQMLQERFAGPKGDLSDHLIAEMQRVGRKPETSSMTITYAGQRRDVRVIWLPLGLSVKKGQPILSFDILTGDLLFVDRITYNFLPPKVGQGFVFKTENINSQEMEDLQGQQIRQYYIKRLVGLPGDKLEVKAPALWRNDQPITGADAFGLNARKEGKYPGYYAERQLAPGHIVNVPAHNYYAMGDNSPRSKDSRYWGYVPEKEVVGKPLFIYYPLTTRWGLAR